jgi:hypothetical protein
LKLGYLIIPFEKLLSVKNNDSLIWYVVMWETYINDDQYCNPFNNHKRKLSKGSDLWIKLDNLYVTIKDYIYWKDNPRKYSKYVNPHVLRTSCRFDKAVIRDKYFNVNFFSNNTLLQIAKEQNYNIMLFDHSKPSKLCKKLLKMNWFTLKYNIYTNF